jgi:hypothetical protein
VTTGAVSAGALARFLSTPARRQGQIVRVDHRTRRNEQAISKHTLAYPPAGCHQKDQEIR